MEQHGEKRYRHVLKWLVVADVDRRIILAQRSAVRHASAARLGGCGQPCLAPAHRRGADGRRVRLRSESPIHSRRGIPEAEVRYQMHRGFPRKLYGPRAKIETVFSVIKRKLSAKAPGRSLSLQVRQALLLGLTFNLYRLRHHRALQGCKQGYITE
jgi:hypothetical protein